MDRETAVKIWQDTAFSSPDSVVTGRMIQAFANKIAEIEREECAKVCEGVFAGTPELGALIDKAAAAIRMRSNAEGRGD